MALCDLETFLSPRRRSCQTWRHKISFRVTWDIIFTTTEETTKRCEVRVTFFESKWMFAPDLVRFSQCALKILCTRTVGMGNQTLFIWPQLLLPLMPQEHLPVNGLSFIYFLWHFLQNSVCNASAYCLHQGSRNNLSDPHELVQTLVKVLVGSCLRTFVLCLMIQFVSHTYKECDLNVSTAETTKKC